MTVETFKHADYISHDIEVLKELKTAMDDNHWVAFVTADYKDKRLQQYSDELIGDFEEFVTNEIQKLQSIFENL